MFFPPCTTSKQKWSGDHYLDTKVPGNLRTPVCFAFLKQQILPFPPNHYLTENELFTVRKVSKKLPAPLIRSTGNNAAPTQQQISKLAAAQIFGESISASITLPLRMKKKLPLKARYKQHPQPAT